MPWDDNWSTPGPGLLRVRFKCGHQKYLPKQTVYREEHRNGKRFYAKCRECRQQAHRERQQARPTDRAA